MDDLETIAEGIFSNAVNNAGKTAFHGTANVIHKTLSGERDPKGRFLKRKKEEPKENPIAKGYNWLENGIETVLNLGKGLVGSALDSDLPQLKAKMYYIVLRQQPPVSTGFKRSLQQAIYDCKSVADLDKLAAAYKVYWQWQKYKDYLQKR